MDEESKWTEEQEDSYEQAMLETGITREYVGWSLKKHLDQVTFAEYCTECEAQGFRVAHRVGEMADETRERRVRFAQGMAALKQRAETLLAFTRIGFLDPIPDDYDQRELQLKQMIAESLDNDSIFSLIDSIARVQKSSSAKAGATAANAKHQDNRAAVFHWLDANYRPGYKHADMAAAIEKLVAREYDTILKDITAWKKKRKC